MSSEISMVDAGFRFQEWVALIRECQSCNTKMYQSDETRNVILNYTTRMIRFYEKTGKCTKPYSLLFNSRIYPHIGLIDAFPSGNKAALQKTIDAIMPAADFKGKIEPFICFWKYMILVIIIWAN